MRHKKGNKKLSKPTDQRIAMIRSLSLSLITHEKIKSTDLRCKETKRFVERLITLGKKGSLHARRHAISRLAPDAYIDKLFGEVAKRYENRNGGYTRIIKDGNRYGDSAPMAYIELVDRDINAKGQDSGPVQETTEEAEQPEK